MAASIVLQWTLRDAQLVNLPWPLLVKGILSSSSPDKPLLAGSITSRPSIYPTTPGNPSH
ncbi:Uncharacterized protein FKW44_001803 [Caligus rogercresseyi]|uniref:Uncharacterized protein n=1 Tax=Caligus rogercresseyi TaxID=217165 RepID=A0A7T8QVU3_CALRO|nr:Uncharacterized protein FKW44_001803 [Caligus rogercresseyi]